MAGGTGFTDSAAAHATAAAALAISTGIAVRTSATRGQQQPAVPVLTDEQPDKRHKPDSSSSGSVRAVTSSAAAAAGNAAGSTGELTASSGVGDQPAAAAAAGPRVLSYTQLARLWQQEVDQGKLPFTEEALLQFAERHGFVRRSAADLSEVKISMMGRPAAVITSAAQLSAADCQQYVHNLAQAVGQDLLQVSAPQYEFRWHRRVGHHRVKSTATVDIRLPAYSGRCSLQGDGALQLEQDPLYSNDPQFAELQLMEAPWLHVKVTSSQTTSFLASRQLSSDTKASIEQQEIAILQPELYTHAVALLKWQLRWQLTAGKRKLLDELPGFMQLQLPQPATGTVSIWGAHAPVLVDE